MLHWIADWFNACSCIRGAFIHYGVCHSRNKYCLSNSDFYICLAKHSGDWRPPKALGRNFTLVVPFLYFRHRVLHTNPKERTVAVFLVLGLEEEVSPTDERIQCLKWCSDSFQSKCIARWWGSRLWVESLASLTTPRKVAIVSFHQ